MSLRRRLVAMALASALISHCSPPEQRQPAKTRHRETIVVLTYGGEFAKAQRTAYFDPFERATGIQVRDVAYNSEYGLIKAGVQSGQPQWDVIDIDSATLVRGKRENLYEPIDYSGIPRTDLLPQGVDPYAVATDFYSVALSWNTSAFAKPPNSWADVWNTSAFPGPRTLQGSPKFTLEAALLADGVKPADIYTNGLDVERAFRVLERIKGDVRLWWTTGQQPIQALATREVVMGAAYGARVVNARTRDGLPVDTTWATDIIDIEYWAVPRGAKNRANAMRFIAFASQPEQQAAFARLIPLGVVNRRAFALLPADLAATMNTSPANLKDQVFLNAVWWADNEQRVTERFEAFRTR